MLRLKYVLSHPDRPQFPPRFVFHDRNAIAAPELHFESALYGDVEWRAIVNRLHWLAEEIEAAALEYEKSGGR